MEEENSKARLKGDGADKNENSNVSPKIVEKTVVVSEEDQQELIQSFAKPIQELDNALDKQHKEERNTMKALIVENVRMEQEVKKANDRVQEMHTKMELMKLDIEAEKAKTKEREDRIKDMENEMIMLIVAKKSEKKEKKKGKTIEDVENRADEIKSKYNSNNNDEPQLPYNEVYENRIKQLNFRLRRLAADDEEKSKRITHLGLEIEKSKTYSNELEKELSDTKVEEVRHRLAELERKKFIRYYDPANVVSSNGDSQRSATCVIQ